MEQETLWHFVRRCVITNTLPRIRVRERLFPKVSKRLRPLAARAFSAKAAGSRTRFAVLALLYGRADQSFYTREIAREVDASVGAVQRELENLSKVELILRKSVGSQVFYQANRDTPIFPEMQALINKTIGIFGVLRSALHPLSKRIVAAFVYGSVAREEETAQSDVDLMVVGKATLDEVLSRLSTAEKGIGRSINPTVYSLAEFKSKLAAGNHFLTSVLKGQKVFLVGDEDELRKVGRVRLAKARTN